MRVLFVTPYYYPEFKFGGPPKRLHAMAKALVCLDHEVSVVTFDSEQSRRDDQVNLDGVTVNYLSYVGPVPLSIPTSSRRVADLVAHSDVVHCFGLYNLLCPATAWQALRNGRPFVLEPMGMFTPRVRNTSVKFIYNTLVTRRIAKDSSAIVATSEIEERELEPLRRYSPLVVRRNGIDMREFEQLPERSLMRERWGVPLDRQVVLYAGRISAKKNLIQLIQAFCQAEVKEAKLVILGPVSEPHYMEQLKREIEANPRRTDIRLEDALYDLDFKAALSAADLFVLPSINENFGNSAAEAVAAGLPVLLTNTCGIAPIIHERAGLAVPLGVEGLTAGLKLMLNLEVSGRMTARRDEVKRELSWDEPIAQTIELYEKIVRENAEPLKKLP